MDFLLTKLLATLVLPPGLQILLGAAGLILLGRYRRTGIALLVACVASLYALSAPPVARALASGLQIYPALAPPNGPRALAPAQAIVVLGGGRYAGAPEYGGDTVSGPALERLRYAARLARSTGLPVLVSGGSVYGEPRPEADLMADTLAQDFRVAVKWRERRSRNTAENATESAALLRRAGVSAVALVTHSTHMRRAVRAFETAGMRVVPAPTRLLVGGAASWSARDLLPQAWALRVSGAALHEVLGGLWYALRYGR